MALILLNYFNSYNIQSFVLFILLSRIIDVNIYTQSNLISIYCIYKSNNNKKDIYSK